MAIQVDDVKRTYVSIREARSMRGLRVVLGKFAVPGPWHEACKGILHVKGLEYTAVRSSNDGASDIQIGMNDSQSELYDWTSQSSAPVMVWEDERPRALWNDQLFLAERLAREPALIPSDSQQRVRMFGLANELLSENGLIFNKRLLVVQESLNAAQPNSSEYAFSQFLGSKYGYDDGVAVTAKKRVCEILALVAAQLATQKLAGSRFLIGEQLSALDIYWSTACGYLNPLPKNLCPMADEFRGAYGNTDPDIAKALTPALLAHRDFVYENYLELPIVF